MSFRLAVRRRSVRNAAEVNVYGNTIAFMPILIEDAWLPATLTTGRVDDDAFGAFVAGHPDLSFEMTASGELIIMPPTCLRTSARNVQSDPRTTEGEGPVPDLVLDLLRVWDPIG